ncbi:hypothetical protein A6R68_10735, partial [Neotoma lepida]
MSHESFHKFSKFLLTSFIILLLLLKILFSVALISKYTPGRSKYREGKGSIRLTDFITQILNPNAAYHIGLSDPGHRQWQWVDQTPYNVTFWHLGEPSSDNEQCVVVNQRYSGWGWNDIPCSYKTKSVCQME